MHVLRGNVVMLMRVSAKGVLLCSLVGLSGCGKGHGVPKVRPEPPRPYITDTLYSSCSPSENAEAYSHDEYRFTDQAETFVIRYWHHDAGCNGPAFEMRKRVANSEWSTESLNGFDVPILKVRFQPPFLDGDAVLYEARLEEEVPYVLFHLRKLVYLKGGSAIEAESLSTFRMRKIPFLQ